MDNNNYNPNPYPYQYPYPYPYPNYTYPSPHPLSTSHSFSYASPGGQGQGPAPAPTSFSGPLHYPPPYSHPYPPPPSQPYPPPPIHHGSFQYAPAPPSRSDSFPGYRRQDSSDSNSSYSSPSSSLYPPVIADPASEPQSPDYFGGYHSGPLPSEPQSPGYFGGYHSGPLPGTAPASERQNGNFFGDYFPASNYENYSVPQPGGEPSLQVVPTAAAARPQSSKASLRVVLLHGNLDVWVYEAKNLPNMDMFSKTVRDMIGALPGGVGGKIDGQMARSHMTSDPYVSISVSNAVLGRTFVISNSENPVWMQHFHVPVAHYAAEVRFVVKDSDVVGSQLIGFVSIPAERILSGERVEGVYPILNTNNKPTKEGATLRISMLFVPIEDQGRYYPGVGAGQQYCGVPGTYFPMRRGGKVTLYQDAHVPDGVLPGLKLDNGLVYEHGQCWRDVFEAISQARKLVYIVGWSVYTKVTLVRDGGYGTDCSLGDLLKAKSQEGVRVLLLIWDDPTSRKLGIFRTDGVMQTHDEETRRFFKHSSVHVLLCPRSAGKRHSWAKQQETGAIYTHHQKTVIVDADAGNYRRKIIAFVGGLDLCDGRYDTPQHNLFRTLQTVHKDDYHNPTFVGSTVNCPREPWHDLHSRIDGPAAYDVLTNFEERWLMAAKPQGINKLKRSAYDDALLRIERIPDIIGMESVLSFHENDPESWNVQIFRSIDSNSVIGFPKEPRDATSRNLVCGKNVLIDMSIHTAYVTAIRAAQHFIYIENQYFLGSSYCWSSHSDLGANNLIPIEIALKIANKIKVSERFAAYIVIPMWPEGVPSGVATQRILFWQNKTMQMMYEIIYKALVEVGLDKTYGPQDYLNFFCLGNREAPDVPEVASESPTTGNTPQGLSRKSRRFMIYVHSKGMIVDDEYVIIGSANINQRSLEGTRDSEIAMGAYQPYHTWATKNSSPRGEIYGYRMSLWAEHTGIVEECYSRPESLDCVRRVKSMGEMNWGQFAADEVTEMRGHLLKYPVEVTSRGKVRPLPGYENFPDVGGTVVGSFLAIQENLTI